MAKSQKYQVIITADAKMALKVTEMVRDHMVDLEKRISEVNGETKEGQKQLKKLNKEWLECSTVLDKNITNTERVRNAIENLSKTSLKDLRRALASAKKVLDSMDEKSPGLKEAQQNVRTLQDQIDKLTGSVHKQSSSWKTAMKNLVAYAGLFEVFGFAKSKLEEIFQLNLKLTDQMANIRKVSGLAKNDIVDLTNSLSKIDTRSTMSELLDIGYAGAKLGIGEYGVKQLEGFVRAADQVNVALKEDLGEEALTALSKMVEVMGLIPNLGVEQSMLKTGSAIFRLASTSTASSDKIVEFSDRLLALGKVSGLTMSDILALGSAADSMALYPEVASTAFSKLLAQLNKMPGSIEKALGLDNGTLSSLMQQGDGMEAILTILREMNKQENVFALDGLFKSMGSDGARLIGVMVSMAENVGMLEKHVGVANQAFNEGTAITQEYNIQQETAAALMQRASNEWNKFFVNASNAEGPIKALAQDWFDMTQYLLKGSVAGGSFNAALQALLFSCRALIQLVPAVVSGLMAKGIGAAVIALTPIVGNLFKVLMSGSYKIVPAMGQAAVSVSGFTAKWKAMSAAMKANVFAMAVSIIAELFYWFSQYESKLTATQSALKAVDDIRHDALRNVQEEKMRVEALAAVARDENAALLDRQKAIAALNDLAPEYNGYLDEETGKYVENEKALRSYIDALVESYEVEGAKAKLADIGKRKVEFEEKRFEAQQDFELAKKQGEYITTGAPGSSAGVASVSMKNPAYWRAESAIAEANKELEALEAQEKAILGLYEDRIKKSYVSEAADMKTPRGDADSPTEIDKQTVREVRAQNQRDLREARDEARAVIDDVYNYYQRQITEIMRRANEQGLDEAVTETAVRDVKVRMNEALSQVRLAISGEKNTWDEFKATMRQDLVEGPDKDGINLSEGLLENITTNNIPALQKKLMALAEQLGKPMNKVTAEIFKNASLNQKQIEEIAEKRRKTIRDILNEHNYTETVNEQFRLSMERIGAFALDESQYALLLGGGQKASEMLRRRSAEIEALFKNVREGIVDVLSVDLDAEGGRNQLFRILFGADYNADDSSLKAVFNLYGDDLKAFYYELLKYSDQYTEAEKKRADEIKKVYEFKWKQLGLSDRMATSGRRGEYLAAGTYQFTNEAQGKMVGRDFARAGVYGGSSYVEPMSHDPEIDALLLKIELAERYMQFMREQGATQEQLAEQQQKILDAQNEYTKSLINQMKERISAMLELAQPIEDFGLAAGDAFARMTIDAEEGRDAMNAAIADMIKAFMKQTVTMTQEYVKRRLQQKINDRLTSLELKKQNRSQYETEKEGLDATTALQEAAGAVKQKIVGEVGGRISDALSEQAAQNVATSQSAAVSEVQTQAAKTQADVALGIAGGSAKTIGSLGWWGIPLIAVISAALNALLGFAMGKVSSMFGSSQSVDTPKLASARVVSSMLTYDAGNVQELRPYVGDDGEVYWATEDDGRTGLIQRPTAMTINGQRALVAERAPEIVIGSDTTRAMMMDNSNLFRMLMEYDRLHSGRHAMDAGNVQTAVSSLSMPSSDDDLRNALLGISAILPALMNRLNNPVAPSINMYGPNGLYEKTKQAEQFMKGKG